MLSQGDDPVGGPAAARSTKIVGVLRCPVGTLVGLDEIQNMGMSRALIRVCGMHRDLRTRQRLLELVRTNVGNPAAVRRAAE